MLTVKEMEDWLKKLRDKGLVSDSTKILLATSEESDLHSFVGNFYHNEGPGHPEYICLCPGDVQGGI